MKVNSKGQVTIPQAVRETMGIISAETDVDFIQGEEERWYLVKTKSSIEKVSRFRTVHKIVKLSMSSDEIMALKYTS